MAHHLPLLPHMQRNNINAPGAWAAAIAAAVSRIVRSCLIPPLLAVLVRGAALFLGVFTLFNVLGSLLVRTFDATIWWIDVDVLNHRGIGLIHTAIALALMTYGVRPIMSPWRRLASILVLLAALAIAAVNTVVFYTLAAAEAIHPAFHVPMSLFVVLLLVAMLVDLFAQRHGAHESGTSRSRGFLPAMLGAFAWALVFPVLQIACFGATDYSRAADAAVVFGAKAYADGTASTPLAERVRTACDLYRRGLVPLLVFSGGPGDGRIHETEAMRRLAVRLGVPTEAIVVDTAGVNTQATVDNTVPMLRRIGARRVMAVSHAYHLPRIKMTYQRHGWNVFTVPALTSAGQPAPIANIMREVPGLWAYYVGALWR